MDPFQEFVVYMLPIIRKSMRSRYKNDYELNAAAMREVYRVWEMEEKPHLPKIFGVKLTELQLKNARVLGCSDPLTALVSFLDVTRAPECIQVDSEDDSLFLTVEDVKDGPILRDWVMHELKGRPTVMWHYLKE